MNVLYVTLISIGAPVLIILCALLFVFPVTLDTKARQAWNDIPREIYAAHRQRLLGLRASYFWYASAVVGVISDVFTWLKWNTAQHLAHQTSFAIMVVILAYQLIWAVRILRARALLDARLVRFARYALLGTGTLLLLMTIGLAADFTSK